MSSTRHDRTLSVFRRVFQDPALLVYAHTQADDVAAWNSFTHMLLITELETEFKISFSFEEVRGFKNVGDLQTCIDNKLGHAE